jgi:hypothetical protein
VEGDNMINPVEFGEIKGRMASLEVQIKRLEVRFDMMEIKMDELIALANQGKGGLWMFRSLWLLSGGVLAWAVPKFLKLLP